MKMILDHKTTTDVLHFCRQFILIIVITSKDAGFICKFVNTEMWDSMNAY